MKRISCLLLTLIFIASLLAAPANAEEIADNRDIVGSLQTFEDGSYIIIGVPKISIIPMARSNSVSFSAEMPARFINSSNEIEWEYFLTATFSYVYGVSATCTNASYSYTIYDDSWKFSDGSTSRSGATAYGYGTFKNKFLFVTTKTVEIDLSMTCDVYGNLS